jgi:phenylacetate-coenzyme A ligase PaaK-like adenylate-forming protein
MLKGSYYSPEVETLERSDLDALIDERVRYTVHYAAEHSLFYRNWFRENGINPDDICDHGDLLHLPTISLRHGMMYFPSRKQAGRVAHPKAFF